MEINPRSRELGAAGNGGISGSYYVKAKIALYAWYSALMVVHI